MPIVRRTALAAALAAAFLLASQPATADVRAGDRASELRAKDGKGKRVKLKSLRGKWVVLTFGASWCKPCKKELPAYEKLARQFKGKDVVFVAVNIDSSVKKGKKFNKRMGLRAVHAVYDPSGSTAETYDPPTTPTTFVIDPKGIVRKVHAGYRSGDDNKIRKLINKYLKS
jgi:peroxiredoxin